ncbi:MAG TPA: sulfatase-like hydrolase/transferase [Bryobacteraceae bacterium]|nr:sulfatase-like hydrolase/transferase [Bryobacteraceae bacterium]
MIGSAAPARRPNVVFILAGGWRALPLDDVRLPNIETLAKRGVHFERLYTCCPSAAPSRAALITGRFPYAAVDQPSLAEPLKRAGYRAGFADAGLAPADPDQQTDLAIDFIKQGGAKPFYLFLAWGPRRPSTGQRHDPRQIRLRANVPADLEETARSNYSRYYDLCSAVDEKVGRLLRTLDDQHLAEDTIVVFTSDSGTMLDSQGLEGDNQPFEESARVPLIVRYPRIVAGGPKHDALLSNVDLMPTLLGLCGVEIPATVQGQDFASHRESIYCSGRLGDPAEWRMVVRGLDKLVVDRELNVTHLYNLGQDPFEMENLARDVSQDLKRDELKALLKDWMRRAGDGMDSSGLKKR